MDSVYVALNALQDNSIQSIQYLSVATAFVAVFVGPLMSYLITKKTIQTQMEIAKQQISIQQKIAEDTIRADVLSANRQDWINRLRDDISECIGLTISLRDKEVQPSAYSDRLHKFLVIRNRISLLINPHESDHVRLDNLLYQLMEFISEPDKKQGGKTMADVRQDVVELSQKILKREWNRVKGLQ